MLKSLYYKIKLPEESYLLWVPRMALCLPLPPGWKEELVEGCGVVYICKELGKSICEHPCDMFILKLLQFLRVKKALEPNCMPAIRIMTFHDELLRAYDCELRGSRFVKKRQESSVENPVVNSEMQQYEKLFNEKNMGNLFSIKNQRKQSVQCTG